MPYTVVFLWISAGANNGIAPTPLRQQLDDFGGVRGLSFVPLSAPTTDRPHGLPAHDAKLVDRLEGELEQARMALSALEEDAAGARLARIEGELLAHPHLPQAAFLMAECLELEALAARQSDPARARELEQRRVALEGPRAQAFGDDYAIEPPRPSITLRLAGLRPTDQLELDGALLEPRPVRITVAPGLHHARVWRAGRPIFATFSEVSVNQTALELAAPPLVPCSVEDLADVRPDAVARGAAPPPGIACPRWALVREEGQGIGVALCEASRCGGFVHWHARPPRRFTPIASGHGRLPAWAGFTIAGAAALVTTGLLLWQSGALDGGQPNAATWEYGGLNPQGGVKF